MIMDGNRTSNKCSFFKIYDLLKDMHLPKAATLIELKQTTNLTLKKI